MPLVSRYLHAKIVILYVLPCAILDSQKANCTILPYVYIRNMLLIWLLMFIQKVPLEGDTLALSMPVKPWQLNGFDFVLALGKKEEEKRLLVSV